MYVCDILNLLNDGCVIYMDPNVCRLYVAQHMVEFYSPVMEH